ncbi:MAG: MBL fold metallo-hydrolase [Promethearchaeota archaeon]
MPLDINILGSGDSIGTPKLACRCKTCEIARKKGIPFSRTRFGILLVHSNSNPSNTTNILVDTGPDCRMQLLRAGIEDIDAIFWTHMHYDHMVGFGDFYHNRGSIDVLSTEETLNFIKNFRFKVTVKQIPLEPYIQTNYRNLKLTPFTVLHKSALTKPIGFLIEDETSNKIVITGDTGFNIPEESLKLIQNASPDVLITDMFTDADTEHFKEVHMTLSEAIRFAQISNAKETYLMHLSHRCRPHDELEKYLGAYGHIHVAYDTQKISL